MAGMSIKHGCQRAFITKQPYLDHSFYQLIYLCLEHKNKHGMVCHGKDTTTKGVLVHQVISLDFE
jgi:hypothetical protein